MDLAFRIGHLGDFNDLMLVATLLTMRTSLGQGRVCYMCGGARGARGLVFRGV